MISANLKEKIIKIKLLILDVDGVLSDGKIILSDDGTETKNFNVKDGLGMLLLQMFGIKLAVITGKSSNIIQNRLMVLGIDDIYHGQKNKIKAFFDLLKKYNLTREEVAYIGDDLPDLAPMKKSAVSFAPFNAMPVIKSQVDYVTMNDGGHGAVREICDLILECKGVLQQIINNYITQGEA